MIRPRKHRSNAPATETEHAERWWERAACKDADETLFYLHGNAAAWETDTGREQAAEAKAICDTCPVALICRTEAVEQRDGDTFRGGMTPQERRLWARAQGRPSRAEKVEHKCDREGCGRTFPSTQALSHHVIRGHATHCENGHLWTPDNTMRVKNGGRECRTCNRERLRAIRARRKEAS